MLIFSICITQSLELCRHTNKCLIMNSSQLLDKAPLCYIILCPLYCLHKFNSLNLCRAEVSQEDPQGVFGKEEGGW